MQQTKKWWESKGIIGPIIAVIAFGLEKMGVTVVETAELNSLVYGLFEGVGLMLGIVGRWKAKKKIA